MGLRRDAWRTVSVGGIRSLMSWKPRDSYTRWTHVYFTQNQRCLQRLSPGIAAISPASTWFMSTLTKQPISTGILSQNGCTLAELPPQIRIICLFHHRINHWPFKFMLTVKRPSASWLSSRHFGKDLALAIFQGCISMINVGLTAYAFTIPPCPEKRQTGSLDVTFA